MSAYLRLYKYVVILAVLALFIGSCSNGDLPLLPSGVGYPSAGRETAAASHACLGLYDILISADRTVWEVVPKREGSMHLNIVPFLEGKKDFITIPEGGIVFQPEYVEATVQLQHPLKSSGKFDANLFTGFDVKGIIMFPGKLEFPESLIRTQDRYNGDGYVLNPDGYSRWWNPVEFLDGPELQRYDDGKLALPPNGYKIITANLHPFKFIYPGANKKRHGFPADNIAQATYQLVLPPPGEPLALAYAIDACHELPIYNLPGEEIKPKDFGLTANQPEAFDMSIEALNNTMWADGYYEGGGFFDLVLEIFDWQDPRDMAKTYQQSRGIRSVFIEAPALFDGRMYLSQCSGCPLPVAHATTTEPILAGAFPAGELIVNGKKVEYDAAPAANTSFQNAALIGNAIEATDGVNINSIPEDDGKLTLRHRWAGEAVTIVIDDTPNVAELHLDTFDEAKYDQITKQYTIANGLYHMKWQLIGIPNQKTILPGDFPVLIGVVDYDTVNIFPGEGNHPTAYQLIYMNVLKTKPYLCENNTAIHNTDLGTGTVDNAAPEWKADCDFIGYKSSPYVGRLLFNKKSDLPNGAQEICVMHVDTPQVASALTLITIDGPEKGIPLILQEDAATGNIALVNHTDQDEVYIYTAFGAALGHFDNGDGVDGFNSVIALDFDDNGDMWMISHDGTTGPTLRHRYHHSDAQYIDIEEDAVNLSSYFGKGYNVYDLAIMPSENLVIVFSADQNGHVEYFDTTAIPPAQQPVRTITHLFDTPLLAANYPGYRVAVGGGLMVDRMADMDNVRCRIIAAADFTAGPLALAKIDFFGNKLSQTAFSGAVISLAMNNDPNDSKRSIVAFPLAETNQYRVFASPASGW